MANYTKPTIKDTYNTIIADYETRNAQTAPLLEIAVVKSLAWAFAGIVSLLWNFSLYQYMQIFVQTCGLAALKMWGALVGIFYKEGTTTTIKLNITGVTASSISAGTVWKYLNTGVTYTAISSADTSNGTVNINAAASVSGAAGNIPDNAVLYITNPMVGVPDTATVSSTLLSGSEPEDIEVYRQRVLIRYRKKPQGGAAIDYYLWATEVEGISDAFPYVLIEGKGTIYIVANGSGQNRTPTGHVSSNPFPEWEDGQPKELSGSGEFLQVANSINSSNGTINDRRPMQYTLELLPPEYKGYNVSITGLTDITTDIINVIKSTIISYLDAKKPNVRAIGYTAQDALINTIQLSTAIQNVIDTRSFTGFQLTNTNNNIITTDTLGIGTLAYLNSLSINGTTINL